MQKSRNMNNMAGMGRGKGRGKPVGPTELRRQRALRRARQPPLATHFTKKKDIRDALEANIDNVAPQTEYPVSAAKKKRWLESHCTQESYERAQRLQWTHITFEFWKDAMANAIYKLLTETAGKSLRVSTGVIDTSGEKSASELWISDLFKTIIQSKQLGYTVVDVDPYWYIATPPRSTSNTLAGDVFLDDFLRSGVHMTRRIAETPGKGDGKIYVVAAIAPYPELWENIFIDVYGDTVGDFDQGAQVWSDIELISGTSRDITIPDQLIHFDHNSVEKYDMETAYGYLPQPYPGQKLRADAPEWCYDDNIPAAVFTGSLLEHCDESSDNTRCPPPLYHTVYGTGELPHKTKLHSSHGSMDYTRAPVTFFRHNISIILRQHITTSYPDILSRQLSGFPFHSIYFLVLFNPFCNS